METLFHIFIVLLLARGFGELSHRLGQSASVGELLAGIGLAFAVLYLGPWIGPLEGLVDGVELQNLADVGIFALLLMAGVEMEPREIAGQSAGAFIVALGGMLVPLIAGCAFGWLVLPDSPLKFAQVLVIGVAMSITAIPATVKVLGDFDLLHTRLGETVVAAAIFDDVFGLILLAILTAVVQSGEIPDLEALFWLIAKVVFFFAITIALGVHIYPRISSRLKEMQAVAMEFSALIIAGLAYGLIAKLLGLHWILGAFMAGLYFESARVGEIVYRDVRLIVTAITAGVLGPFFFASIGLQVDLGALWAMPLLVIALAGLAFAAKMVGAGISAALAGMSRESSLAIGAGMTSRGAVELVVLSVAYNAGVFSPAGEDASGVVTHLFSALVLMALANTLCMPVVLRAILKRSAKPA